MVWKVLWGLSFININNDTAGPKRHSWSIFELPHIHPNSIYPPLKTTTGSGHKKTISASWNIRMTKREGVCAGFFPEIKSRWMIRWFLNEYRICWALLHIPRRKPGFWPKNSSGNSYSEWEDAAWARGEKPEGSHNRWGRQLKPGAQRKLAKKGFCGE